MSTPAKYELADLTVNPAAEPLDGSDISLPGSPQFGDIGTMETPATQSRGLVKPYPELNAPTAKASTGFSGMWKIIIAIISLIVIAGIVTVIVVVVLDDSSEDGGTTYTTVDLPPTTSSSGGSSSMMILVDEATGNTVARSYDGNEWEGVPPHPLTPDCSSSGCTVTGTSSYRLETLTIPDTAANVDADQSVARLFLQATFGPKQDAIDDFLTSHDASGATDSGVSAWINAQMALDPTSLRAYTRARHNPRQISSNDVGSMRGVCEDQTRWHKYAFTYEDINRELLVSQTATAARFTLSFDGIVRTELEYFNGVAANNSASNVTYVVCDVMEGLAWDVELSTSTSCDNIITIENPVINLTNPNTNYVQIYNDGELTFAPIQARGEGSYVLTSNTGDCQAIGSGIDYFIGYQGEYYKFDPRLVLLENTVDNPVNVSAQASLSCPSVARTFLNEDGCISQASCAALVFNDVALTLDDDTIHKWYSLSGVYVYYITNLRQEDDYDVSPCDSGTSRWERSSSACSSPTALDAASLSILEDAIRSADVTDNNPYVIDITVDNENCTATQVGASIDVDGTCFTHVHPHLYNVHDLSGWVLTHDGNDDVFNNNQPNPIAQFAVAGFSYLAYPASHPMSRWEGEWEDFTLIGRYGDSVSFESLQTELQTEEMAEAFGAIAARSDEGFEVCGSPAEVANDPTLGHRYSYDGARPTGYIRYELDWPMYRSRMKEMAWLNVMIKADDQLRQRMAWALAQIIPVSHVDLSRNTELEIWAYWYDIFIRNAFGNYRDILREVSYSPMMANYLTFRANKAYENSQTYPDENYAREIMQLFTIGLYKLHNNGTEMEDSSGLPVETYTNHDILTFSRIWTGFDYQADRGNLECENDFSCSNLIDPMQIKTDWRDSFPKTKLEAGYIGDKYPLCSDLPALDFLNQGATYMLTGSSSGETHLDDSNQLENPNRARFTPTASSPLYQALCAADSNGQCTFPTKVELDSSLNCYGDECDFQVLRSVKIIDWNNANKTQYYAYHRPACTKLTLFSGGRLTKFSYNEYACADPTKPIASPFCCTSSDPTGREAAYGSQCKFAGESISFDKAQERCAAAVTDGIVCRAGANPAGSGNRWKWGCSQSQWSWTNQTCELKLQINVDGYINIYDETDGADVSNAVTQLNSNHIFRVYWDDDRYPTPSSGGCPSEYCVVEGETCVCDFTTTETAVFVDNVPSAQEARDALFIGAHDPTVYFGSDYSVCTHSLCTANSEVTVYVKAGVGGSSDPLALDAETIFRVPAALSGHDDIWLINKVSTISLGYSWGQDAQYSFRNPPHFMNLVGERKTPWSTHSINEFLKYPAKYEVEALIDHLFEHDNTAPFIAYRLIQRLVTSNPTPRYVETVANAFRTGAYDGDTYSGKYGCLAATIAAILRDREARSSILLADQSAGKLREPLIKIVHFLRAMEYQSIDGREVSLADLIDVVGMEVFNQPTVFGFYLPEYQPDGVLGDLELVSPESQILTGPNLIGFLNGMDSLIRYGLTTCQGGLGESLQRWHSKCSGCGGCIDGSLSFSPSSSSAQDIVAQMDLLLTGRRTNDAAFAHLVNQYENFRASMTQEESVSELLRLYPFVPEFHTLNINSVGDLRQEEDHVQSNGRTYKAIVVLVMSGGADSYNMIVPHSNCPDKDMYAEYSDVRTNIALSESEILQITTHADTPQVCDTFGVHPAFDSIHSLYNDGDLSFISNIGNLIEPLTYQEYKDKTKEIPPSPFAHNLATRASQNLEPQTSAAKGVIGRIVEELKTSSSINPYKTQLYSISGNSKILEGSTTPHFVNKKSGISRFQQYDELIERVSNLTQFESSSLFAETFAKNLEQTLSGSESLGEELDNIVISTSALSDNSVSQQLNQVAKLIKLDRTVLDTERAAFVTSIGGFDVHTNAKETTHEKFDLIDNAIANFVTEMKDQGIWDDVVIVTLSEFARTLTSNGQGTDHAWGGNMFVAGGSIDGGKIHGTYPDDLTDEGELNLGRGRLIPTTPWEAMWKPVAKWFGLSDSDVQTILPNINNFGDEIIHENDMFE